MYHLFLLLLLVLYLRNCCFLQSLADSHRVTSERPPRAGVTSALSLWLILWSHHRFIQLARLSKELTLSFFSLRFSVFIFIISSFLLSFAMIYSFF